MIKSTLEQVYSGAAKFRIWRDGAAEFMALFPNRAAVMAFYDAVSGTTWPEFYGQSPYDDAFGIAFVIKHGLSQSSAAFLRSRRGESTTENKLACLAIYGITLDQPAA
jgi:hypothetical protein